MLRFASRLPFGPSCDLGAGERRNLRGTPASAAQSSTRWTVEDARARPGLALGAGVVGHAARPRSIALTVDRRSDMKRFEDYGAHGVGLASPTQVLSAWQLPPRQHTAGEGAQAGAHETGRIPPRSFSTSASNSCTAARLIAAKGP
jgi:hypothetical protein